MKKIFVIVIIAVTLLSGFRVAFAQEPTGTDDLGNLNDPMQNERANACYEGGSMAGKCDSEWAWVCGWYLIRYEARIFTREQVHTMCASLLPRLPEQVAGTTNAGLSTLTWPSAGCHYSPTFGLYIIWAGNQTQGPPMEMTWDGTCATPPHTGIGGFFFVSVPDSAAASTLCTGSGYSLIDQISSPAGAWPIYRCN